MRNIFYAVKRAFEKSQDYFWDMPENRYKWIHYGFRFFILLFFVSALVFDFFGVGFYIDAFEFAFFFVLLFFVFFDSYPIEVAFFMSLFVYGCVLFLGWACDVC